MVETETVFVDDLKAGLQPQYNLLIAFGFLLNGSQFKKLVAQFAPVGAV